MDTLAIYKPGSMSLQTTAYRDGEVIRCRFSGYLAGLPKDLTAEEYLAKNPGFCLMPIDEAIQQINKAEDEKIIGEWKEITEEEWMDALGCLPPEKWETVDGVNIFRMCEYRTGNITAHYARYKGRFYTASRRTSVPYADMAKEIKGF